MMKKILCVIAIMASITAFDMLATDSDVTGNTCTAACNQNDDGYIYKGTIVLTRVVSGKQERFYLFNKGGVDYVAASKSGPYYRLARRMTINNIDYKY